MRLVLDPSDTRLDASLTHAATTSVTYPEVGATRTVLPAGYRHLRRRTVLGGGAATFRAAAGRLRRWDMHRTAGLRVAPASPAAATGSTVVMALGSRALSLLIPCRVVWTVETDAEIGFGYGSLPGHPESGEESFVISIASDDTVFATVTAFSRPAGAVATLGSPIGRRVQDAMTRRYLAAVLPARTVA